jgi:hypothetical protein
VSALGRWRRSLVQRALGVDLPLMSEQLAQTASWQTRLDNIERGIAAQRELLRRERDGIQGVTESLAAIRLGAEYAAMFEDPEPLVSVRIASFEKTEQLMDVAIRSVLDQSYQNFEVIVVNDGPNKKTRKAIAKLRDSRIHYEEFAERSRYPSDSHARWMVAGSPGMNRGADLARGVWLAPLDDDDAFSADHLEKLLALARRKRAELAYGALIQRNLITNTEARIWSSPPAISQFSFQGAIYLRALHSLFRYDESSWLVNEPGDWNLIRRMSAAGVRMAGTPDVVAVMNQVPYTHKPGE